MDRMGNTPPPFPRSDNDLEHPYRSRGTVDHVVCSQAMDCITDFKMERTMTIQHSQQKITVKRIILFGPHHPVPSSSS